RHQARVDRIDRHAGALQKPPGRARGRDGRSRYVEIKASIWRRPSKVVEVERLGNLVAQGCISRAHRHTERSTEELHYSLGERDARIERAADQPLQRLGLSLD